MMIDIFKIVHGFILLFIITLPSCNASYAETKDEDIAKKSYVEKKAVKVGIDTVSRDIFSRELVSNGKLLAIQALIMRLM